MEKVSIFLNKSRPENNTSEQGQLKSITIFAAPMAMVYQARLGSYIAALWSCEQNISVQGMITFALVIISKTFNLATKSDTEFKFP